MAQGKAIDFVDDCREFKLLSGKKTRKMFHKDHIHAIRDINSDEGGLEGEKAAFRQSALLNQMSHPLTINMAELPPPNKQKEPSIRKNALEYLFYPLKTQTILDILYNPNALRPLLIKRQSHPINLYKTLFTSQDIKKLLYNNEHHQLQYGLHVDVTKYVEGHRHTYNSNRHFNKGPYSHEGEVVDADVAWKQKYTHYGCSLRVLHPQRYSDTLWHLVSKLESQLNSCVGTNSYLTPAGSQGFAPHWDDIHACICQVEGKKKWKVYAPVSAQHVLPLRSSKDFDRNELGDMIMDVVLEAGDFLFLPRGVVHEATSLNDAHSLHVTVSFDQGNSYSSFLRRAFMQAIDEMEISVKSMRCTLPGRTLRNISSCTGGGKKGNGKRKREKDYEDGQLLLSTLAQQVYEHIKVKATATAVLTDFMFDRMPPPPAPAKILWMGSTFKKVNPRKHLENPSSRYAYGMAGWNIAMVSVEKDKDGRDVAVLSHCCSNNRSMAASGIDPVTENKQRTESDDAVPPSLEFPIECIQTVEYLIGMKRNQLVFFDEIPHPKKGCRVSKDDIVSGMIDAGLVVKYKKTL